MPTVRHRGRDWPVNPAWDAEYTAPWPELAGLDREQIDDRRRVLLAKSNTAPRLTEPEREELDALDQHFNVRNALLILGEPDLSRFGFTYADQLHGARLTAPCGCEILLVHDHHAEHAKACAQDVLADRWDMGVLAGVKAKRLRHWEKRARAAGLDPLAPEKVAEIEVEHHYHTAQACPEHAHLEADPAALHAALKAND